MIVNTMIRPIRIHGILKYQPICSVHGDIGGVQTENKEAAHVLDRHLQTFHHEVLALPHTLMP